jgi:hypothetical protein
MEDMRAAGEIDISDWSDSFSRPFQGFVRRQMEALVLDPDFPCLGARSAFQRKAYEFRLYPDMTDSAGLQRLGVDLQSFTDRRASMPGPFATFVACFEEPRTGYDEKMWDHLVWRCLMMLHRVDQRRWSPEVDPDPDSPTFAFSFAGEAYFVVGLHPGASRHSRRFAYPALAFNAHEQFQQLRHNGEFERFQRAIRGREVRLQGSLNPNLADFGELSDARQYSGTPVGPDWRCPFHARQDAD